MRTVKKTVKTDRGEVEFTYQVAETEAEIAQAHAAPISYRTKSGNPSDPFATMELGSKVSLVSVYEYGHDLKIRAKLVQQNSAEGGKVKQRTATTLWAMTKADEKTKAEVLGIMASGDTKVLNAKLDELYEANATEIVVK